MYSQATSPGNLLEMQYLRHAGASCYWPTNAKLCMSLPRSLFGDMCGSWKLAREEVITPLESANNISHNVSFPPCGGQTIFDMMAACLLLHLPPARSWP